MSSSPTLFVRVEASAKIGIGHIMRCLALAEAWIDSGGEVVLFSRLDISELIGKTTDRGIEWRSLSECQTTQEEFRRVESIVNKNKEKGNWICVDGYDFDAAYLEGLVDCKANLLLISDLAMPIPRRVDILLNQNIGADKLDYPGVNSVRRLLGTDFALIRKEFSQHLPFKKRISRQARHILVTCGGSDPDGVTLKILENIRSTNVSPLKIRVVVGPANKYLKEVKERIEVHEGLDVDFYYSPDNLVTLMEWADLAISSGGSTLWELFLLGVPTLGLCLADNQANSLVESEKRGAIINCGSWKTLRWDWFSHMVNDVLMNSSCREQLSQNGQNVVDGHGAERVVEIMREN
jgi:UDP-2,4-diacetamido-2,4,6-trideoxy-beta-L-altropyranose hydrolase